MRIEILHLQNTDTGTDISMLVRPKREEVIRLLREGFYERIAVVETDKVMQAPLSADCRASMHLETAFIGTQNDMGDGPWLHQDYVEEKRRPWARSTMVGDLLVCGDRPYVVMGVGFKCLVTDADPDGPETRTPHKPDWANGGAA